MSDDDTLRTAAILAGGPFTWVKRRGTGKRGTAGAAVDAELRQGDKAVGMVISSSGGGFGWWVEGQPTSGWPKAATLAEAKAACERAVIRRLTKP